jgi:UDP-N-acetylglucosamine diphosphorylase/glucosamine-1-phosphate N-acetyltransferase
MNLILFDKNHSNYLPLSFTRPISFFRIGILTIKEKWQFYYNSVSIKTEDYLSYKFKTNLEDDNIWVDSSILPCKELITEVNNLRVGESLIHEGEIIAFRNKTFDYAKLNIIESHSLFSSVESLTDIFNLNENEIINDFERIKTHKNSKYLNRFIDLYSSNVKIGDGEIFIEDGAILNNCTLNTSNGPIYIGKDAEIMEGSLIRGPFAMLNNTVVKMGARIYPGTTLGPFCKVGGEVNNSVFFGYSSKAHDGYLGNSVIGEWCNLGADTNNSNLKNNYINVKLWNYQSEKFKDTNLQFCGLIMGDHSKCGINTMFNTGTVVGIGANIFGCGFPRNFIPSFSWGGSSGFSEYKFLKFIDSVERVFTRRNIKINQVEIDILNHIFEITKRFRNQY